ncbi:hypothetical protein OAO87_00110 [bacterium]|nr:hypothetical protein [bacterium]
MIRLIVYNWVKPREDFDQVMMDLELYWEEREDEEDDAYDDENRDYSSDEQ